MECGFKKARGVFQQLVGAAALGAELRVFALELDAGPAREQFKGIAELESLDLHDEVDMRAAFAAAEAVPNLPRRRDHERGCLFGVERTRRFPIHPRLVEADVGLDELDDIEPG